MANMGAKEILDRMLNRGPDSTRQVTTWLGGRENWGGNRRRYVGLLTQTEISEVQKSFTDDPKDDSCWGDRAFSMFPERFNPR